MVEVRGGGRRSVEDFGRRWANEQGGRGGAVVKLEDGKVQIPGEPVGKRGRFRNVAVFANLWTGRRSAGNRSEGKQKEMTVRPAAGSGDASRRCGRQPRRDGFRANCTFPSSAASGRRRTDLPCDQGPPLCERTQVANALPDASQGRRQTSSNGRRPRKANQSGIKSRKCVSPGR